jgi:hypothetical protein
MGSFRTNRTFDLLFLLAISIFIWWAAIHRTSLGDWIYFLSYHPEPRVIEIAASAGLNPEGRQLLYRTNPAFEDQAALTAACDVERLGCLDAKGRAYILNDVTHPQEATVTAVHEMLHLAYRRLSQAQKDELAPLIDQAVTMNSSDITDELKNETSPDDRRDEAHSLLGTEYARLPAGLEHYYAAYFSDRTKILTANTASQH